MHAFCRLFRFHPALLMTLCSALWISACSSIDSSRNQKTATPVQTLPATPLIAEVPPLVPASVPFPHHAPSIHAESAIMIDARTGRTLYYKNATQKRAVASTQKLITAMLVLQRGNLSQSVVTQVEDTRVEPSKLGYRAGQTFSRHLLLSAMMVKSSNDVAYTLARDHSGSIPAFSRAMNQYAASCGATQSHFINPHGLTAPGQYSTAQDMAKVAYYAYRNHTLRQMMRLQELYVPVGGRTVKLEATNKLLARSPIYTGMKTGYTVASGRCLISSASYQGRDVILVQLGSKTKYIFNDAESMMQWGLQSL